MCTLAEAVLLLPLGSIVVEAAMNEVFVNRRSLWAGLSIGVATRVAVTLAPGLLVALIPVSLGGWGVREGAFVVLLGFYGVAPEQGLIVSVLFGLALLAASLPGLALWLSQPARAG